MLDELSNPAVREVVAQKSAQIGWTDGVLMNWLGQIIDEDPAASMVLFPADKKGKEFNAEKFEPAVEATPSLAKKLVRKSRARENRQDYKDFPGGSIKFVGSNSPANVKSTTAKNLAVEEPDDCNLNIKGQGDSITMLEERGKRFRDRKLLVGGTPSIKELSAIEARMKLSDKRFWFVPCHHCGEEAPLRWEQVQCRSETGRGHPVYGDKLIETTMYACQHCSALWTNAEKIANVKRGRWVATGENTGVAGFYFNELMSVFPGSELSELMGKYLIAKHELDTKGDITKMIVFWNQTLGLPWEYKGKAADADALKDRVEDYPEWYVPYGALILTVGVDVQHDRLAAVIRGWGEGEESWLIWAGEFYGNVLEDDVWNELERTVIFRKYRHVSGIDLHVSAVSVDTSDGQTADAGYKFCRRVNRRFGVQRAMPIKGATNPDAEIFRKPATAIDVDGRHRSAKNGLKPYMVGVGRAKDLILGADEMAGRVNLKDSDGKTGRGPGRYHWYRGVRGDYFDQLTAEVKAPARDSSGRMKLKKVWLRKAGKANEFLDCEVYALHAARALRIDTYTQAAWQALRARLLQATLFNQPEEEQEPELATAGGQATEPEASASTPPATMPAPVRPATSIVGRRGRGVRSRGIS